MSLGCGDVNRIRSIPSIDAIILSSAPKSVSPKRYALTVCPSSTTSFTPRAASSPISRIRSDGRNRALAAAHVRHHAERAELVASAHRGHVGAHAAAVVGRDIGVSLGAIEPHIDGGVEAGAANHLGQAAVTVGPRDHVEERGLLHDRDAIVLRHASEQPDLHLRPRILEPRKLPQPMQHLLFGMLANRAGVEQDDVRIFDAVRSDVTRAAQNGADRLRIGDIHLASVGLEINPRMRRIGGAIVHKTKRNLRPRRHVDTTRRVICDLSDASERCAFWPPDSGA